MSNVKMWQSLHNTLHRKADKYIEKKIHRTNRIIRQGKTY